MVKLISLDLDGTLLSPNGQISKKNKQAILKARAQGIEVIIATGRSFDSACRPLAVAQLTCPIICVNGAERYSIEQKRQAAIYMDKQRVEQLMLLIEKEDVFIEVYTNQGIYAQDQDKFFNTIKKLISSHHPGMPDAEVEEQVKQRLQDESILFTDSLTELVRSPDINVLKVLAFSFESEKLARIKQVFIEQQDIIVTSSSPVNLEFNHPQAQKGLALKAYAKECGISLKHCMAIGDNENDRSMLELVGRSVAMGNAKESIKQIADIITATNEEDGVAQAIETILN